MRFWRRYRPARAIKPACPIRPQLEVLEDRCVPSIDLVTNPSGSAATPGSLLYEVAKAAPGDTIQFAPSLHGATINLANTLDITNNLTIDGAGSGITVNGGGHRVFQIEAGVVADINALTITGAATGAQAAGGIFNKGSLTLTNSTVTGNSAFNGGGIYNNSLATMTMSGDTINNNTAQGFGGGVDNLGKLTIINCTIAGNQAFKGGGISNDSVLNVVNSTVADNTVTGTGADGGGIVTVNPLNLLNTIVYNPNSGAATSNDVLGTIDHTQGSLFGSTVSIASGGDLGGNQENINPQLGPSQNNGGPTATMALQSGSPAIAAGAGTSLISGLSVPTTDQRGDPRPANSIDSGAFQTQSATPQPLPTSVSLTQMLVTPTLSGEAVTLTAQVSSPGGPVNQGTVTFSLAGHTAIAPVNANGLATAQVSLPGLTTATPLTIGVSYSDNGTAFDASTSSVTGRFIATDALMPSTTHLVAGGGETITDLLFGLLSLSRSYDAQGRLTEVDVDGIALETFGYNAQGQLAVVGVLGVQVPLPVVLPPQLAELLFQDSLGLPLVP